MLKRKYLLFGGLVLVIVFAAFGIWLMTGGGISRYSAHGSYGLVSPISERDAISAGQFEEMNVGFGSDSGKKSLGMPASAAKEPAIDRLIIKTGSLSLVVKDVREAVKTVTSFAVSKGGFVVASQINESGIAPTANITVRVPSEIFDSGVNEIKKLGDVESESINGQDVTEEYVDMQAQLKNLSATENQFLAIMRQAVKIQDILDVQRELGNVRGQIERITGRVKYLEQSAKLSTLSVYFSTDPSQLPTLDNKDKWRPLGVVKEAARYLVEAGKMLVNVIIWLVVFIPVWVVLAGIVVLVRRRIKKMNKK